MFSKRTLLAALAACVAVASAACGSAPDGSPAPSGSDGTQPGGVRYDESGNPLPAGDQPDPTGGQEGSGDLPVVDSGAPGSDAGAPPSSPPPDGGPATDSGATPAGDAGATPPSDAGATLDSGSTPPPPPPPPPASGSPVAAEAARELSILTYSTYDHTTSVDESIGQFIYDCSGFVGYDLTKAMPDALATISAASGTTRPLAKDFEAFFAAIPVGGKTGRWHRVVRAADLIPGDVVAWLKPADVTSSNTGHVLIVRLPVSNNPKRSDEWLVPITDSTSTPHGATDSRTLAGTTGLGTGTIGLLVNSSGVPVGYRWTGGVSAHDELTSVALGRAE
jgi:hypothetical protein